MQCFINLLEAQARVPDERLHVVLQGDASVTAARWAGLVVRDDHKASRASQDTHCIAYAAQVGHELRVCVNEEVCLVWGREREK